MANIPNGSEKVVTAEAGDFDLERALNNRKFQEFLAKFPDAETMDLNETADLMQNGEAIRMRFENFNVAESLKPEMSKICREDFKANLGIELNGADLASVSDHFELLAIEDPEKLRELSEKMKLFKKLPAEIETAKAELAKFGPREDIVQNLAQAEIDKFDLDLMKEYRNKPLKALSLLIPFYRKEDKERIHRVSEKYGIDKFPYIAGGFESERQAEPIFASLEEQISQAEQSLQVMNDLDGMKALAEDHLKQLRSNLFSELSMAEGLNTAVEAAAKRELRSLLETGTLDSLDKAGERFQTLLAASESGQGVDPLGDAFDAESYRNELDAAAEAAIGEQIRSTLERSRPGSNQFTALKKTLSGLLGRDSLGSKSKEETAQFIGASLIEAVEGLGNSTDAKIKKLFVAGLINELRKTSPEFAREKFRFPAHAESAEKKKAPEQNKQPEPGSGKGPAGQKPKKQPAPLADQLNGNPINN